MNYRPYQLNVWRSLLSNNKAKSNANRVKHSIDFETAKGLWLDENRVEIHAPHPIVDRGALIKVWLHERVKQEKVADKR